MNGEEDTRNDRLSNPKHFSMSGTEFNLVCASGDWSKIPLRYWPEKNCEKCYGRGYVGKSIRYNDYVACSCTKLRYNPPGTEIRK